MTRIAISAGLALLAAAPAAHGQAVATTATIYAWLPAVEETLQDGVEMNADRSTILDNLDFALMGEIVQRRGEWLFAFDGFYSDLGKSADVGMPISPGDPDNPDEIDAALDFSTSTTIFSAMAGRRMVDRPEFEVIGTLGLRYTHFETSFTAEAGDQAFRINTNDDLLDVIAGVRGTYRIDERWALPFVADIGTGSSDLTWQAFGGVSYSVGRHSFTGGWRHMAWQLGDGGYIEDIAYDGPLLAYSYRF